MVVSPSWLPFFLQNPQKTQRTQKRRTQKNKTQKKRTQRQKHAIMQRQMPQRKTQDETHAKSPHIIQNPAFIPQMGSPN